MNSKQRRKYKRLDKYLDVLFNTIPNHSLSSDEQSFINYLISRRKFNKFFDKYNAMTGKK